MAYRPDVEWMKGWDQGAQETRQALDGENAYDEGYHLGHQDGRKELREELADLGTYDADEVLESFDVGYRCGQVDERKKWQDLDLIRRAQAADPERFRQLSDAIRDGGVDALRRLARRWEADDLMDLAEQSGATPLDPADVDAMVAELNDELDVIARRMGSKGWIPGEDDE